MTLREKHEPGPNILQSAAFENVLVTSIRDRVPHFKPSHYGHQDVREQLNLIYGNKCAYCESKIEPVSTAHVDHYRPVKSYNANQQGHLGYYWLGYEWTNLLQSCPSCNQAKSSKFHLSIPTNRKIDAPALLANNKPDYASFHINHNFFQQESSLLINPERTNPDEHLTVNFYGELEAIENSIYGSNTIAICKLNRHSLTRNRLSVIDEFIKDIEKEILEHYREDALRTTDEQYQHRLNGIFQEIIAQQHQDNEYNLVGRCIVEKFEDLVLVEIETEFRDEILGHFITFLESI